MTYLTQATLFDATANGTFQGSPHAGTTFEKQLDGKRLNAQTARVFALMKDAKWRTLAEIESETGDGQASISARLRDLRKTAFGGHTVNRQRRGEAVRGLFEYQLITNE